MDNSKQRIQKKANISIQTCSVGALADMENRFGFLWGHGEDYEDLTLQQKKFRDLWAETRNSILDRAENSKRILLNEIEKAEFREPERYTTVIRRPKNERR